MNLRRLRSFGHLLLSASLVLAPVLAHAGIVTTEQMTARQQTDAERARIQSFVERAGAAGQLQLLGIGAADAQSRVEALSDEEVHALTGRIDSLPAGGNFGSFTDEQVIIVLLLIILVIVLV